MLGQQARELWAFLEALAKDPCDVTTRSAFADWLDDADEPELAEKERAFSVEKYRAERRLRRLAEQVASGDYEGMIQGLVAGDYCFSNDDYYEIFENDELYEDLALMTGGGADAIGQQINERTGFRCAC